MTNKHLRFAQAGRCMHYCRCCVHMCLTCSHTCQTCCILVNNGVIIVAGWLATLSTGCSCTTHGREFMSSPCISWLYVWQCCSKSVLNCHFVLLLWLLFFSFVLFDTHIIYMVLSVFYMNVVMICVIFLYWFVIILHVWLSLFVLIQFAVVLLSLLQMGWIGFCIKISLFFLCLLVLF